MRFLCFTLFVFFINLGFAQKPAVLNVKLTEKEKELARIVNNYRKKQGLAAVPVSVSLTYVAQCHVKDLTENYTFNDRCNQHSWSDKGPWTPCCYTSDHSQASCMWNKPRELTNYKGIGFEIAFFSTRTYNNDGSQAADALLNWQNSPGHNSVICNQDIWSKMEWKAIGIGVDSGYSVIWFGIETDPAGYIPF